MNNIWILNLLGEYFYSFTGVPYATPPISNMRFQEAEPRLGWHGDLDATQTKNACPRFILIF